MSGERITVHVLRPADRPCLQLQWVDRDGRRRTRSARTADVGEARRKAADLEYELSHGLAFEPTRTAWQELREAFLRDYAAGRRRRTRENYVDTLDVFEAVCRPSRVEGIDTQTVTAFVTGLRSRPVRGRTGHKASTIKVRLQHLRTVLRWAAEQGYLSRVPKFPVIRPPRKRPQPVPPELFERLLERAPDQQTKAYLLTGWLAGLRLSEAYELRWEESEAWPHLDLSRSRIVLPAEFAKADEDQWVPLDPALRAALEALPRREGDDRVFRFVNVRKGQGERPVSASAVSDRVCRLARRAGVRLTMHTLRKGFGCRYAGRCSAQVLQRLMRHASIATTMNYYASVDDAVEAAVLGNSPNAGVNATPAGSGNAQPGQDATAGHDTSSVRS